MITLVDELYLHQVLQHSYQSSWPPCLPRPLTPADPPSSCLELLAGLDQAHTFAYSLHAHKLHVMFLVCAIELPSRRLYIDGIFLQLRVSCGFDQRLWTRSESPNMQS